MNTHVKYMCKRLWLLNGSDWTWVLLSLNFELLSQWYQVVQLSSLKKTAYNLKFVK